jgi:hypothetical protein
MKISAVIPALLVAGASAAAVPGAASSTNLQARQQTGSYTISGLGARKKQVTAAGANSFNLAIAMLETERLDTNVSIYPLCTESVRKASTNFVSPHQYAYGDNKQNDAANFGIFKQNWGLLRVCCSRFKGQSQSNWNNGAVLK